MSSKPIDKTPIEIKGPIAISNELYTQVLNLIAALPANQVHNTVAGLLAVPQGATRSLSPLVFSQVMIVLHELKAKDVYFLLTELIDDAREALKMESAKELVNSLPPPAPESDEATALS